MAGNNAIQILRSHVPINSSDVFNRAASEAQLLDGQLFWDRDTGWLFIGKQRGDGTLEMLKDLHSIQVDFSDDCLTVCEVQDIWTTATGTMDECDCTNCRSTAD